MMRPRNSYQSWNGTIIATTLYDEEGFYQAIKSDDDCFCYIYSEVFHDRQSFDDYVTEIHRRLVLSSWHYSPERAQEIIEEEMRFVEQGFWEKEPIGSVVAEIGYGCG